MVAELPLHFCPSLSLSPALAPWTIRLCMVPMQEKFNLTNISLHLIPLNNPLNYTLNTIIKPNIKLTEMPMESSGCQRQ